MCWEVLLSCIFLASSLQACVGMFSGRWRAQHNTKPYHNQANVNTTTTTYASPITTMARSRSLATTSTLNTIVPLQHTQVALFEKFIENYAKVALAPSDSLPVRLFVVCFLPPGSNEAKSRLESVIASYQERYPKMVAKVMLSSETYSRGLALQLAVDEVTFTTPQGTAISRRRFVNSRTGLMGCHGPRNAESAAFPHRHPLPNPESVASCRNCADVRNSERLHRRPRAAFFCRPRPPYHRIFYVPLPIKLCARKTSILANGI